MSGEKKSGNSRDLITPDLKPHAMSNDNITPLDMGSPVVGPKTTSYFDRVNTTITLDPTDVKTEKQGSGIFARDEAVSESVYTSEFDEKSPANLSRANLAKLDASSGPSGIFGPLSEEDDFVPELEPGSERFPRRKESEISNIFSKIPDLLRPSISQFSLGTVGSPVPSPPPRLSSRNYNFPDWQSESEYNESEYGSQYISKPGTPFQPFKFNRNNMESASSFYPTASPSGRASFDLESTVGDQSRSATPGRFSLRHSTDRLRRRSRGDMHWTIPRQMGRRKKSAMDMFDADDQAKLNGRKRSVSDPPVDRTSIPGTVDDGKSKAPRTIISMMNSEKGAVLVPVAPVLSGTVAAITRSDTVIQRPSNTIPARASITTSRTPVTPPKRSVKETAQIFSKDSSTGRSGPRYRKSGAERPSNLRVVETRVDSEDEQSDKLLKSKGVTRSRSLRIKKSFSRGFSKVKAKLTPTTPTEDDDANLDRPPSRLSRYDKINYASSSETLRGRSKSRAAGAAEILKASNRHQSHSPIRRMTSSPAAFDKTRSPTSSTASRKPSLGRSITAYPHPSSRRGTMSSQSVYRVLRNTAYDECVAYPFGSDGEEEGYSSDGKGLDLMRKKTPGLLNVMDIFPEEIQAAKAGKSDKRMLRELKNSSLKEKRIK